MKVFHIINTLEVGGAQSLLLNLITHWKGNGDSHIVISLMPKTGSAVTFERAGIPVFYLNMEGGKFSISKFISLIWLIRNMKPNIVQTWLYHSDLIGGLSAWIAGAKSIIWGVHHTTTNDRALKTSTRIVISLLVQLSRFLPDKIICCSMSAFLAHAALGYPEKKMITITNGVDTDLFLPDESARQSLRMELGLSMNTPVIGMFARYHPQKDHANFIRAAGLLSKTNPEVHYVLSGEGIDKTNCVLGVQITAAGIYEQVHLLGKREDMPRLLAAMDVISLSSAFGEALPLILCEGMSCGVPCVGTNVGDIKNLIANTGRVVKTGNPQALADAWKSVLTLPQKEYHRLSVEARQRVLMNYGLSQAANFYEKVYKKEAGKN